jgi:hypothetical protein
MLSSTLRSPRSDAATLALRFRIATSVEAGFHLSSSTLRRVVTKAIQSCWAGLSILRQSTA